jgi:hypothetical protein
MILDLPKLKAQLGGVQGKLNFETVLPFVKIAERDFRKTVGAELYDFLNEAAFGEEEEIDLVDLEELLEITQGCIAWAAYDLAIPHLKLRVGDLGLLKTSPSQTVAVSKWEYVDTREANMVMVDLLWEFFWEKLEEIKPEVWVESDSYKRRNEYFLRSADELTEYVALVGRNRRFFSQLEKFIKRGEQLYISETITAGVFDALKVRWKNPETTLTSIEKLLVERIREALAYLTLHEAYPYLPIKVDDNGLREVRKWDGITNESTADSRYRDAQRQQLWQDAQLYLGKLRSFMDANATISQFPEYYTVNLSEPADDDEDFTDKSHVIL